MSTRPYGVIYFFYWPHMSTPDATTGICTTCEFADYTSKDYPYAFTDTDGTRVFLCEQCTGNGKNQCPICLVDFAGQDREAHPIVFIRTIYKEAKKSSPWFSVTSPDSAQHYHLNCLKERKDGVHFCEECHDVTHSEEIGKSFFSDCCTACKHCHACSLCSCSNGDGGEGEEREELRSSQSPKRVHEEDDNDARKKTTATGVCFGCNEDDAPFAFHGVRDRDPDVYLCETCIEDEDHDKCPLCSLSLIGQKREKHPVAYVETVYKPSTNSDNPLGYTTSVDDARHYHTMCMWKHNGHNFHFCEGCNSVTTDDAIAKKLFAEDCGNCQYCHDNSVCTCGHSEDYDEDDADDARVGVIDDEGAEQE
jgi:hypothetical protein